MSIRNDNSAIMALILGNSYVNDRGYLSISSSINKLEYLEWKQQLINNYCVSSIYFDKKYSCYRFDTVVSERIRIFKRMVFQSGKKVITSKMLDKTGVLGISILYLDFGELHNKTNKMGFTSSDLIIRLNTTELVCQDLIDYFKSEYNISFGIKRNKNLYSLRCGTKNARLFLDLVRSVVPELTCFINKLHISSNSIYNA